MQAFAAGKGIITVSKSAGGANVSAGTTSCGHFTAQLRGNDLTSTMPGTVDSWITPPGMGSTALLYSAVSVGTNGSGGQVYGWLYKFGTLSLSATGDRFTHDAATFPVTRTIMGVANTAVPLIPLVQITTASATTAPVFRLRTVAGAAGYTNQDGAGVVGTKTMTMPAATTNAGSTFFFRLESGDSAVTDISAVEVTTAGTAGAATIWGLEILSSPHINGLYEVPAHDVLYGGLGMNDLSPAVATSGTASAVLGCVTLISGTGANGGVMFGVTA